MTIYSFRAECLVDVERFLSKANELSIKLTKDNQDEVFPDIEIEFESDTDIEGIRNVLRQVVDGHVMIQTLRPVPLSENSLERDWDLE